LLGLLRKAGKLDPDTVIIDGVSVRAFGGGEATGPSPVDRRKKGAKHTLMVDRHGVPLAVRTTGANASDHRQFLPLILETGPNRVPDGQFPCVFDGVSRLKCPHRNNLRVFWGNIHTPMANVAPGLARSPSGPAGGGPPIPIVNRPRGLPNSNAHVKTGLPDATREETLTPTPGSGRSARRAPVRDGL
jgi:hypothetical protein